MIYQEMNQDIGDHYQMEDNKPKEAARSADLLGRRQKRRRSVPILMFLTDPGVGTTFCVLRVPGEPRS